MSEKITNKKIALNLIISLVAQAISVITSFIISFVVPKFIDEYQYSYWQTFVLSFGNVGILHFGLIDGLVLRYSQYDYDELDKPRIRSQFLVLLVSNAIMSLVGCIVGLCLTDIVTRELVILVAVGIVISNIFTYTSYTFQMTNRISKYAILVISQRIAYAIFIVILLVCRINDFYWYCIADLFGYVLGICLGAIFNRGLYFGKIIPIRDCLKEYWRNISAGIMLMIANFTAGLLVSGARMIIQWRWDELVFGQVSFSFSVSNAFLIFVTAISVVLFPSLKRMNESELPNIYVKIRNAISPLLFFAMILYFPGCWILERWLPNYTDSLVYLGILLPIIIFSSKVSLLTNNYLKAYRKEKLIFVINVGSVTLGIVAFALGAYVFNNLEMVLYLLVAVIMLRSVVSEIAVMKIIKKNIMFDFIIELIMTIIFIIVVEFLSRWWACLAYACALIIYSIIYRKSIVALFNTFFNLFKKKSKVAESDQNETT